MKVGAATTVTAVTDRTVSYTGYRIVIRDTDSNTEVASCTGNASCSYSFSPPYSVNNDPPPRHFRAEVQVR